MNHDSCRNSQSQECIYEPESNFTNSEFEDAYENSNIIGNREINENNLFPDSISDNEIENENNDNNNFESCDFKKVEETNNIDKDFFSTIQNSNINGQTMIDTNGNL